MNQDIEDRQGASDDAISKQAYYLWEADGRPDGRDMEYWLKAKTQLSSGKSSGQTSQGAPSPSRQSQPNATAQQPAEVAQNGEKQPRKKKNDNRTPGKQPAYA